MIVVLMFCSCFLRSFRSEINSSSILLKLRLVSRNSSTSLCFHSSIKLSIRTLRPLYRSVFGMASNFFLNSVITDSMSDFNLKPLGPSRSSIDSFTRLIRRLTAGLLTFMKDCSSAHSMYCSLAASWSRFNSTEADMSTGSAIPSRKARRRAPSACLSWYEILAPSISLSINKHLSAPRVVVASMSAILSDTTDFMFCFRKCVKISCL
mmetsp:Transcript_39186/g.77043  ORF Transcript_39186/g.77043 Transcript_39186/m.77043 type:complete len:208 (+) Transcript_39186:895-1518(+)